MLEMTESNVLAPISSDVEWALDTRVRDEVAGVVHRCVQRWGDDVRHLAADIVGEVLEVLARSRRFAAIDDKPGLSRMRSFAWGVAKNKIREARRSERDTVSLDSPLPGTDGRMLSDELADPAAAREEPMERYEVAQTAHHLLQGLSDEEKKLLHWRFYEDRDYDEVAKLLGVPHSTCRQRYSRLMRKIRERGIY